MANGMRVMEYLQGIHTKLMYNMSRVELNAASLVECV